MQYQLRSWDNELYAYYIVYNDLASLCIADPPGFAASADPGCPAEPATSISRLGLSGPLGPSGLPGPACPAGFSGPGSHAKKI